MPLGRHSGQLRMEESLLGDRQPVAVRIAEVVGHI